MADSGFCAGKNQIGFTGTGRNHTVLQYFVTDVSV